MQANTDKIKSLLQDANVTIGDAAARVPAVKAVFEQFGLDYCCGGNRNLQAEMSQKGITLDHLVEALEQSASDVPNMTHRNWTTASLTELIEHILSTHHAFMKRELPRIDSLLDKVSAAHGKQHGQLLHDLADTFQGLREEIEQHLFKEEQILFPMIMAMEAFMQGTGERPLSHCGTVQNPIRQMEHEHENAGQALARMRELTHNYQLPADACMTFGTLYEALEAMEKDLHEHIHLENNILFPSAVELETAMTGA